MLTDGITLIEGSYAVNLTVSSGNSFPINASIGEVFYKLSGAQEGLHTYNGSVWNFIAYAGTTLAAYGITDAAPLSHTSDLTVHLSSAQNTWIDAITASSAEVNYLVNVTSSVQTQLDAKVAKSGSSMDSAANLVFSGGGTISGLPLPNASTQAASKAYVDSLTAGITWKNPVDLVNLVGSSTSPPGSPLNFDAYIIDVGGATGVWSTFAVGDVVQYHTSGSNWLLVQPLAIGQRYGVAFTNETTPTGVFAGKLLQVATITNATAGSLAATFEVPVLGNAVFVGNPNAALFGNAYTYVASTAAPTGDAAYSWVQFSGTNSASAGTGLIYNGNVLNINLGAGIQELPSDEVGIDVYSTGGLMTTVDGTASSTATGAQLSLTKVGTAGTYTSVTTDAYGRITAGTNPAAPAPTSVASVTTWTGLPYDITGSCFGVPAASQVDIRFTTGRAFVLPANLTGSVVKSGVAATGSSAFLVQKNGSTVATITFAAAGTSATFSTQAAVSFAVNDKIAIVAPASADATLADIDFFILATLA